MRATSPTLHGWVKHKVVKDSILFPYLPWSSSRAASCSPTIIQNGVFHSSRIGSAPHQIPAQFFLFCLPQPQTPFTVREGASSYTFGYWSQWGKIVLWPVINLQGRENTPSSSGLFGRNTWSIVGNKRGSHAFLPYTMHNRYYPLVGYSR
jgi:hypothetical protein